MPSWFGGRNAASRREGTSPQELIALMRSYLVQETVGPLRRLVKSLAFGLGGAAAFGLGGIIVLIGLLRLLETETGGAFDGNWSFAPTSSPQRAAPPAMVSPRCSDSVLLATTGTLTSRGEAQPVRNLPIPFLLPRSDTGSKVTLGEIEDRLRVMGGSAQRAIGESKQNAVVAGVVGAVLLVAGAYLHGRRRGRRRSTVLEIRRV